MRWWKTAAVSAAVMFGVTGCGGAATDDPSTVRMLDNRYMPADVEVTAGGSLEFLNDGRVDHNVIDVDGEFDSRDGGAGDQKPGEAWSHTFTEPGVYSIYCSLHAAKNNSTGEWSGMVGTVTVAEGASNQ
ncbi:MAG: plastocyanin/azurin family copper-binding protein [Acidimicrobiia bacterium]|nr:plastocyanin/azurin family copper-binding protein [Acidimicrobiia bacterium]